MKDVRRKRQRKLETLGRFQRIRTEAKATTHCVALGIADTQNDTPESLGAIHCFQNDTQDIVQLEFFNQRVADILNAGHQNGLRIDPSRHSGGLAVGLRTTRRAGRHHPCRKDCLATVTGLVMDKLRTSSGQGLRSPSLHLLAEGRLFHVDTDDRGKLRNLLK